MTRINQVRAVSWHASIRCQQRGVTVALLNLLQEVGDRSVPVGAGCVAVSLSRREARRLRKVGHLSPANLERLDGLTLIESSIGQVITVLHTCSRHYRKIWN